MATEIFTESGRKIARKRASEYYESVTEILRCWDGDEAEDDAQIKIKYL